MIALLIDTLRSFGLTEKDFMVRLSSRNAWHDFFTRNQGDPAREYDFFQAIDKLEREAPADNDTKLARLGFSLSQVQAFIDRGEPSPELDSIMKNLAARGLGDYVQVDYRVIRGLAYYTGAVFEAFDRTGEFRAIAGGGRYDGLVKLISGGKVNLPALGFGARGCGRAATEAVREADWWSARHVELAAALARGDDASVARLGGLR